MRINRTFLFFAQKYPKALGVEWCTPHVDRGSTLSAHTIICGDYETQLFTVDAMYPINEFSGNYMYENLVYVLLGKAVNSD